MLTRLSAVYSRDGSDDIAEHGAAEGGSFRQLSETSDWNYFVELFQFHFSFTFPAESREEKRGRKERPRPKSAKSGEGRSSPLSLTRTPHPSLGFSL